MSGKTDDIVEVLRARAFEDFEMCNNVHIPLLKAADEIDRLRATILAALDCLHHDDPAGARKALTND